MDGDLMERYPCEHDEASVEQAAYGRCFVCTLTLLRLRLFLALQLLRENARPPYLGNLVCALTGSGDRGARRRCGATKVYVIYTCNRPRPHLTELWMYQL